MATVLNPYLNFNGRAREAMTFYQSVFGGELTLSTFGEFGQGDDPARADLIMHGQLESSGMYLMGSDGMEGSPTGAGGFTISLSGTDDAELRGFWNKLVDGGTVTQPLVEATWGDSFGMCVDKFGTPWMVNITAVRQ